MPRLKIYDASSAQWRYVDSSVSTYNIVSASYASSSVSASYAGSASYLIGGVPTLGTGSTYPITSSWSNNSLNCNTASYVSTAISSSYAGSASYLIGGSSGTSLGTGSTYPITASWAVTSSYITISTQFGITIDAGGGLLTTGTKGYVRVPKTMTITGWDIVSSVTGSIVVDVWKTTYANWPPSSSNSIAGTQKPTLTVNSKNQNTNLTTWTGSCVVGDYIAFNVDSVATCSRVNVFIYGTN